MVNYREILRLRSLGRSYQQICVSVGSSKSTVQEVLNLAKVLSISWPVGEDTSNETLEALLYPGRAKQASDRMPIDFPQIHRELAKKGVTLSLLWTEYCSEAEAAGRKPYMSTQFGDLYRSWAAISKATMRIQRKPGETSIPEHMPEAHRRYLSYNKDEFLAWGTQIGSATHQTVESFLTSGKEPEQGFKYCSGLTKAADRYGKERLEAACARVLVFSTEPTLRSILTVLKNGQDKIPLGSNTARKENGAAHHRSHGITRGAEAFRQGGENA